MQIFSIDPEDLPEVVHEKAGITVSSSEEKRTEKSLAEALRKLSNYRYIPRL